MWSALYVAGEASLLSFATILSPAFAHGQKLQLHSFLEWHLLLLICSHMQSFFFFLGVRFFVLFSSPYPCTPPTCYLFAVWCPGWSWMASISTCLKPRTSRPTGSVQTVQVCSVTLKLSSLATRRTYVALFLSTPTSSVEGGKLGEWRSPRSVVVKVERFCVTPAQCRGVNLATHYAYSWLCSTAAASSYDLVLSWKSFY